MDKLKAAWAKAQAVWAEVWAWVDWFLSPVSAYPRPAFFFAIAATAVVCRYL